MTTKPLHTIAWRGLKAPDVESCRFRRHRLPETAACFVQNLDRQKLATLPFINCKCNLSAIKTMCLLLAAFAHRMIPKHNDVRYQNFVQTVLHNPSAAAVEDILGFIMNMNQVAKRQLAPVTFSIQANIPVQLSPAEEGYFLNATMANLNYSLGRNADVIKYIDKMLPKSDEDDMEQLICIKRYLSLSADHYDAETIHSILSYFHRPDTVRDLFEAISEKRNPLDRFTLHCGKQCEPSCILYGSCVKKQTDSLSQIISTKRQEMDHSGLQEQFKQLLQ